ncbi:MAG: SPOR domain-containing protein [Candidatus Krumholzibacteriales bacterium]
MSEDPKITHMGEGDISGGGGLKKTLIWLVPLVVVIAVVIIFVLSGGDDEIDSEYYELVARANTEFNRENYEQARELYMEAMESQPDDPVSGRRIAMIDSILAVPEQPGRDSTAAEVESIPVVEEETAAEDIPPAEEETAAGAETEAREPVEKEPEQEKAVAPRYKYHIVVGSFENRTNATNFSKKLIERGVDSKTIPIMDGKMTAVTYGSFNNKDEAVRELRRVQREFEKGAWLLEQ